MKKIIAVAVLVVSGLIIAVVLWPHADSRGPSNPASTSQTEQSTTSWDAPSPEQPARSAITPTSSIAGPYSTTAQARRQWEPVLAGFGAAFPAASQSAKTWADSLKPYVTRRLYEDLSITDPDKIPAGHYAGYQVVQAVDEQITAKLEYQEGWAMIVYLEPTTPGQWRIRSFTSWATS